MHTCGLAMTVAAVEVVREQHDGLSTNPAQGSGALDANKKVRTYNHLDIL